MVKLIVKDKKVEFQTLSQKERNLVKKCLKFRSPGYEYSPAYQSGTWDGWFRFYDKNNVFSIGFLDDVLQKLNDAGVDCNLVGEVENDVSWVEFGEKFKGEERDYQRFCVMEILKKNYGIIKMPTRGGKTYTIAEAIRLASQNIKSKKNQEFRAIFIVDTIDLMEQAIDDFSIILGVSTEEIGRVQGDVFILKEVNVAMIQTVTSLFSKRIKKPERKKQAQTLSTFLKNVDFFAVDEIQEYSTPIRKKLIEKFSKNSLYRIGMSATPWDDDDLMGRAYLLEMFGRLIYDVKEVVLKEKGVLVEDKVALFWINRVETLKGDKFLINLSATEFIKKYRFYIALNEVRNRLLREIVTLLKSYEIKVLILVSKNTHGDRIAEFLGGETFINGETLPEDRKRIKNEFLLKKGGVLIASNIFKKGITLPQVQVMVNASGDRKQSLIIQRRGRVMGSAEGKSRALTVDFIDDFPKHFGGHTLERIEVYEKLIGTKNIHIFDLKKTEEEWKIKFERLILNWLIYNEEEHSTKEAARPG